LCLNRPEHAVISFVHSCKLLKTIEAYEGMVECFCEISLKGVDKYHEAMNAARLAMLFMPHSPRSIILLGNVLSLKAESKVKVKMYHHFLKRNNINMYDARQGGHSIEHLQCVQIPYEQHLD